LDLLDNSYIELQHEFLSKFKHAWADNGDMISRHYSGTGSTHTSAVKNTKKSLTSGIKNFFKAGKESIKRYYKGNFRDFDKQ